VGHITGIIRTRECHVSIRWKMLWTSIANSHGANENRYFMPRIPNNILDCVFYLYRSAIEAKEGKNTGGCGFLVLYPSEGDPIMGYAYAVTCRHLIDRGYTTIRLNNEAGGTTIIETTTQEWEQSRNNDIAAKSIDLEEGEHKFRFVFGTTLRKFPGIPSMINKEIMQEYEIGIGDEVFLVGRLLDHEGKQQNAPSARFGHIAALPSEPIWNDDIGKHVSVILCEVKSVGGFSGSPVFVSVPSFSKRPHSNTIKAMSSGPWLLGIDWGHTVRKEPVRAKNGDALENGQFVRRNSGITCVAPTSEIIEVLNCENFRSDRMVRDVERKGGTHQEPS